MCMVFVQVAHRVVEETKAEGKKESKKKEVTIKAKQIKKGMEEGQAEEIVPDAGLQVQSQSVDAAATSYPATTSPHVTVR